jgi:energy-coupling factor transporter ATP-binding protein EcfA2
VAEILSDISGYVLPGEMLLVLGPPGSGTSTLLNVLANHYPKSFKVTGKVSMEFTWKAIFIQSLGFIWRCLCPQETSSRNTPCWSGRYPFTNFECLVCQFTSYGNCCESSKGILLNLRPTVLYPTFFHLQSVFATIGFDLLQG